MKSDSTKTINGQLITRNLSGVKFNSIYCQLCRNNRGNERNAQHSTWPIRSSLTWHRPRIHRLSHPTQKILLLKQLAQTGTAQLPCSKLKNSKTRAKATKNTNKNKTKWRQHAAKRWSLLGPTLTSLVSISASQSRGHLRNVFVKASEMLGFWSFLFL